jgi:hypothetical protein
MTLDEIYEQWNIDSKIDPTTVGLIAISIPQLHHKYYKMMSQERLQLKRMESELKVLKLEKQEFFVDGPTKEQIEKGWKSPSKGRVIKSDVAQYMDADSDIIKMNLKIAYQAEKIDLLESIIKTISNLGFQIKSYLEWERFRHAQ